MSFANFKTTNTTAVRGVCAMCMQIYILILMRFNTQKEEEKEATANARWNRIWC